MNERVLIVDDTKSILDVLTCTFKKEGYLVERACNGPEALDKVKSFKPQIIILDSMIPLINGYDVCKKIEDKNIGIIMLSAKNDIVYKILGLELGADDYLIKPLDIREVLARAKSLLRRVNRVEEEIYNKKAINIINIKDLHINKRQRKVSIKSKKLELTSMEFDLLYLLLSNPNIVYSREQLLDIIWGIDYIGVTRTVDTHVQRIRKKLGRTYQNVILTVHGVGYKGVDDLPENKN